MTVRQPSASDDFAAEPRSIDLRDYWLIVRRRWALVLTLTMAGALGGFAYAHSTAPTYAATSQVVVMPLTQGLVNSSLQVNTQVNMSTEQAVAQSPLVIAEAAQQLHIEPVTLQADAAKRLNVSVPANTLTTSDVLQITWKAGSPQASQTGANAFAQAYLLMRHRQLASQVANLESALNAQVTFLQKQITRLTAELSTTSPISAAQQNLTVRLNELTAEASTANGELALLPTYNDSGGNFIAAELPLAPSGLGHKVIVILGALLGLLLGLLLAFVRDSFDDRVRDSAQLERKLEATTLAVLPQVENRAWKRWNSASRRTFPGLFTATSPEGRAAESVRALRATLVAVAARRDLRTLLVACADTSTSSSRMAAELGVALAESGRRVLVMAADMRGSSIPELFDLPDDSGLSDMLTNDGNPKLLARQPGQAGGVTLSSAITQRLWVIPSGPPTGHALASLDSGTMLSLLQGLRDAYDFVVLDSPPASVAADVFSLAAHVDGVVVLARQARSKGRVVEDLRRRLDQVGALVVGGVLIAKGNARRHRYRQGGPLPAVSKPSTPAESSPSEPQPGDTGPAVTRPLPALQEPEPLRPSSGAAKRFW